MTTDIFASHIAFTLDEALVAGIERDTDPETARLIAAKIADEIQLRGVRIDMALSRDELTGLWREAHTLKSLAATLGVTELRLLALSVEMAGRNGDPDLGVRAAILPAAAAIAADVIRQRFGLRKADDM